MDMGKLGKELIRNFMKPVSVVIITYNEESNSKECL